jgi:hypothetical protein
VIAARCLLETKFYIDPCLSTRSIGIPEPHD